MGKIYVSDLPKLLRKKRLKHGGASKCRLFRFRSCLAAGNGMDNTLNNSTITENFTSAVSDEKLQDMYYSSDAVQQLSAAFLLSLRRNRVSEHIKKAINVKKPKSQSLRFPKNFIDSLLFFFFFFFSFFFFFRPNAKIFFPSCFPSRTNQSWTLMPISTPSYLK